MNIIKSTTLATFMAAVLSPFVYADNFSGTLGTSASARDVILFKCSGQVGITVGSVSAQDGPFVNAADRIKVQIAKAASPTTCPAFSSPVAPADLSAPWLAGQLTGNDSGAWSTRTFISVSQVSPNNYYCIAVTKNTASAAQEDYSLNHHCEIFPGDPAYQFGSFVKYSQNQ